MDRATHETADMATQPSPEQLLALVQAAIREAPTFGIGAAVNENQLRWLGRVDSLLAASGNSYAVKSFQAARRYVGTLALDRSVLLLPLYDVLSALELQVPSSLQGAFIPPGDTWNGYASLVKLVQTECDSLLIVDPYISADLFLEFLADHSPAWHRASAGKLKAQSSKLK